MDLMGSLLQNIETHVPDAIYTHAAQSNLIEGALADVVRDAAHGFVNQMMESNPVAGSVGGLLGRFAGMLGGGDSAGLGDLMTQALDHTDVDERLRAAVLEGFQRYLAENGPRLGQTALEGVKAALQD